MAIIGCASCHAIDATGDSPLVVAPPFREIVRRRGSDDLAAAFEQGLVTTHPAMPPYVFGASQIHDLTAYLDTLRAPVGRPSTP
ncbi:c-type cytochrome [Brevundimonas sp. TWP2-3-2]|uniref:c-type cytochrome n=1 Tax=unclassified Brevundimonas TaxID=2622653 RepID=UPI003CF5231B